MTRSRIRWIGGVIAVFLTAVVSAEPPTDKFNNRSYGNAVNGGACSHFDYGQLCRAISVWENYDVKGAFEYVEASFETWRDQSDPNDGS